jgi:HTH-type transcriptional regulator/antitoxin HipB
MQEASVSVAIARSSHQVGRLIHRFRHARGLTQTQLAQLAGQRQEMISKIETGQGGGKLDTLFDILAALGLEMALVPRSKSSSADIEDIF